MPDENTDTPTLCEIYPAAAETDAATLSIARSLSQAERDKIADEDFAGPDRSFPIDTQAHLDAAAHLIGHADNPAAVKAKAIRIAKRKGLKLPESWQEGDDDKKEERSAESDALTASDRPSLYMPITRAAANAQDEWIVEGQATSEALDSYGTVFDYESAKKAFARWRGNLREQHDPHKAVGTAINWMPDDENKRILLRSRVSKGAPDTWQKILDGVLTGYSVSLKRDGLRTEMIERSGKRIPKYYDYDYAEVSYVDAPGSPNCDIAIVRADGLVTEVLDDTEEQPPVVEEPKPAEQPIERAGARVSHVTQDALHSMRNSDALSLLATLNLCDCEECQGIIQVLDPDDDGDVDIIPSLDYDDDNGGVSRNVPANPDFERSALAIVERMLQPVYARLQAIAGDFARNNQPLERSIPTNQQPDTETLTRALSALDAKIDALAATSSSYDEVRSALVEVKGQVDRIAAQPLPGGPVLNGAYPVDKRLATDPYAPTGSNQENQREVVERLHQAGAFKTLDDQIAAVATLIKPVPGGRR